MGLSGLLVRFADRLDDAANRAVLAFRSALEAARPDGVEETAASLGSVFLRFDPGQTDHTALSAAVGALLGRAADARRHFEHLSQTRRTAEVAAIGAQVDAC